jgi:hypothetical protein
LPKVTTLKHTVSNWFDMSTKEKTRSATDIKLEWDLRKQLQYNTPLQKLYEKVYFEEFDLAKEVEKYLGIYNQDREQKHDEITAEDFRKVINDKVRSIDHKEFGVLMKSVPKVFKDKQNTNSSDPKKWFVLYRLLDTKMKDLVFTKVPIASIYQRFKHTEYDFEEKFEDDAVEDVDTAQWPDPEEDYLGEKQYHRGSYNPTFDYEQV